MRIHGQNHIKYTNTLKTQQIYYDLLLQGYMFRLLRVITRPSNELTQDYLIPSALWDPVALTIVGAIGNRYSWVSSLEGLMMTLSSRNM